jgi:hypothetical protein
MAKGKRAVPEGFVRVLDRRNSGAAGPHKGRTNSTRGADKRAAVQSSREGR